MVIKRDEERDEVTLIPGPPSTKTPQIFKVSLFASTWSVIDEIASGNIALSISVPTSIVWIIFNEILSYMEIILQHFDFHLYTTLTSVTSGWLQLSTLSIKKSLILIGHGLLYSSPWIGFHCRRF